MRYFSPPCGPAAERAILDGRLSLIDTPYAGRTKASRELREAGVRWSADNGAFTDRWDEVTWWAWLTRHAAHAPTCDFATAPDVVGDAWLSNLRSMPWLDRIRDLGYPVAYVAQDGAENHPVPWHDFDVLFIGGTTEWKLGPAARVLMGEATAAGKPVHMGRVNSLKRFTYARTLGCASVDGTYLTRGPDANLPRLLSWVRSVEQGDLLHGLM